ncbi:MAG: 1-deoxy-D-xylulose-5-phosphate reductoisomerase [Candidatus Aminicenantes bacterium]|nr:1-deoxy-D-xylulose-5-phosphate reductoisomerase [Candidatus Aminicenantes bacterium]
MKKIAILGSTGSIGQNTLEVVRRFPDKLKVEVLVAGCNLNLLRQQIEEFHPRAVAVRAEEDARQLRQEVKKTSLKVYAGEKGLEEVVCFPEIDLVVSAITGVAGLKPTLKALELGVDVALANKESMVVAGPFIKKIAARTHAKIIPIDSEHSGIFQCLDGRPLKSVRKVYLTASGGPFLRVPLEDLANKSQSEALAHPRWKMGKKVSIDSATLMNKGLELIEARFLFDLRPEQLDVLIHPQSIVHALVEFRDGSCLAQLSQTDMKIPIQYALSYPERWETTGNSLDLSEVKNLEFLKVEESRFPLLALARRALEVGGSLPVVLNAANEVAVEAFLEDNINFRQIYEVVEYCLMQHSPRDINSLDEVLDIDQETRKLAREFLKGKVKSK